HGPKTKLADQAMRIAGMGSVDVKEMERSGDQLARLHAGLQLLGGRRNSAASGKDNDRSQDDRYSIAHGIIFLERFNRIELVKGVSIQDDANSPPRQRKPQPARRSQRRCLPPFPQIRKPPTR